MKQRVYVKLENRVILCHNHNLHNRINLSIRFLCWTCFLSMQRALRISRPPDNRLPPFDATQPLKGWADPSPAGQPYLVFDSTAAATGYISQMTLTAAQASQLNLPGVYNYPAYVAPPTDAVEVGPYGPIGTVSPDQVCLQADAQAVANEIAPLYPGQTISVVSGELRRPISLCLWPGSAPPMVYPVRQPAFSRRL